MAHTDYFKDKKVTVMGLGLLGRGVGDAAYIADAGAAEVIVTDLKTEDELRDPFNRLKDFENITFRFGEHREDDFKDRDLILVAAGVRKDSPYLQIAHDAQIPLKQSAALFAELSGIPIIGVTGTRGKSTVTQMIHHVLSVVTGEEVLPDLNHSERMTDQTIPQSRIVLGGNIRGVSNLQLLKQVTEDSLAVMELDSWQLQGFGWAGISPQIAVFTNFMEDHLNYYQREGMSKEEAMTDYFFDKAQIFANQNDTDVFVTTPEVFKTAQHYATTSSRSNLELRGEVVLADASVIPEECLLSMPGEHNRLNAALAYEALKATSLKDEQIFEALATFPGVEGRLQYVKTIAATDGGPESVRIYNDNNATEPNATIAGLTALDLGNKNIILIAGGADKRVDLAPLTKAIEEHCKALILTPGSGTEKLVEELKSQSVNTPFEWNSVADLSGAIEKAQDIAENGDIILFSPAFASFAQYKNEYERNDEFMSLVCSM